VLDDQPSRVGERATIDRRGCLRVAASAEHGRERRGVQLGDAAARDREDASVHFDEDDETGRVGHVDELVRQVRDPLDVRPRRCGGHEHFRPCALVDLDRIEQSREELPLCIAERRVQKA
jgi:hypothetical protein